MTAITPRGIEINADAALPFEAIRVAQQLLRTSRTIALATLDPSGYPYNTVTNFICETDGTVLFYVSGLAVHARNIERDNRIAVTVAEASNDVLTTPRLTLVGRALRVGEAEIDAVKTRYQATFPKAKLYLALRDTALYRVDVESVQLNGGPARNANDVLPMHLRVDLSDAKDLMTGLDETLQRLNTAACPKSLRRWPTPRPTAGTSSPSIPTASTSPRQAPSRATGCRNEFGQGRSSISSLKPGVARAAHTRSQMEAFFSNSNFQE